MITIIAAKEPSCVSVKQAAGRKPWICCFPLSVVPLVLLFCHEIIREKLQAKWSHCRAFGVRVSACACVCVKKQESFSGTTVMGREGIRFCFSSRKFKPGNRKQLKFVFLPWKNHMELLIFFCLLHPYDKYGGKNALSKLRD